jgi:ABC-type branched-subunit amino acid transport system ATPase component
MPELTVENVSAGYGGVHILHDLSLHLAQGETLAVLGPNGSGKSTLIKTIMGQTDLYQGRVTWDRAVITNLPTYRRVLLGFGYVPQTQNVFPGLSVVENLTAGGLSTGKTSIIQRLDHIFHLFPRLKERRATRAGDLSGGERRMLALAAALIAEPKCLLLDEPTSDLAPVAIASIFEKIQEVIREYQVPALLVEQNVRRALEISDRVCVLVRGHKKVERPSRAITEDELGELFLEA